MNVLLKINEREKNKIEDLKSYEDYLIERLVKNLNTPHSNSYILRTLVSSYFKNFQISNKKDIKQYHIDIMKNFLNIQ